MQQEADSEQEPVNAQKTRGGINRIWHATRYSAKGLRYACGEAAFRQELMAALVLVPVAFWLGQTWVERALLAGSAVLVLIVELLNTGIEKAIDRVGPEWHELSMRAKDVGSAAVFLSLLTCCAIWLAAVWARYAH